MTAAERREAIMEILCVRRHEATSYFMKRFGVCRNTITKDVEMLSLSYPIYTLKGNGGGIYVVEGFRLNRVKLNEEQTRVLKKVLPSLSGRDRETVAEIIKLFGGGEE